MVYINSGPFFTNRLEKMKAEVTVLEHKLKSHELEREKQANEVYTAEPLY